MSFNKMTKGIFASISATALVAGITLVGAAAPANAATPTTGGTLYYYSHQEQWASMEPSVMYTGRDMVWASAHIFRNLTSFKPAEGKAGTTLIPDLATNTGVPSNKAKTWKFTLRPGVTWQDGSAITCADLKYGMSRNFAQELFAGGPYYAVSWLDIPEEEDGSSAYKGPYVKTGQAAYDKAVKCSADNRTITYNLKRSVPDFNYFTTYPASGPIKESADTGEAYGMKPLSAGPYKIDKYEINGTMELSRNAKWKKSSDPIRTPYPDKITVRFGLSEDVRDEISMKDTQKNGVNLDGLQLNNNITFFTDQNAAAKARSLNVVDPFTGYLAANSSPGHLDCVQIRKAVFFAYPTAEIIKANGGTKFYGTPGDNPVKPSMGIDYIKTKGNIHDANYKIEGNPTYAKKLLDEAKTVCPEAYDRATNPAKGLKYYRPDTSANKTMAVIVEEALKKAGFVIETVYKPSGTYNTELKNYKKETDFLGSGWASDWPNASTVLPELLGEGCCNYTFNKTTKEYAGFKKILDKALIELDRNKQAKLWHQASQYAMDQYWYIFTVFNKDQLVWGSKVGGVFYWDLGSISYGSLYVKK
jgi:peptide/nickel transport system substrate-binding protein